MRKLKFEDYEKIPIILQKLNDSECLTYEEKEIISSKSSQESNDMIDCYRKLYEKLAKQFCPHIYMFSNKPAYCHIPKFSMNLANKYKSYSDKLVEVSKKLTKQQYKMFFDCYVKTTKFSNKQCLIEFFDNRYTDEILFKLLDCAESNI